ncbi:MAG: HNH endonuclease [Chloroflexi bacterium]|nr:HNH endonuclease [Chloroflexota bacterium]
MSEALSGHTCQIDHIVPFSLNRHLQENNLCLACVDCSRYKLS